MMWTFTADIRKEEGEQTDERSGCKGRKAERGIVY